MALEDLTGTGKFIHALNPAWPVDDDWVDEGDNHIRGIKNVLKNSFPATDAAIYWSSQSALFPDGTVGAPGISWNAEQTMGVYRVGAQSMGVSIGGVLRAKFGINAVSGGQLTVSGGYGGSLATITESPIFIDGPSGYVPGIGIQRFGAGSVGMSVDATLKVNFGTTNETGPTGMGKFSMQIEANGAIYGRSFNPIPTLLRTNVRALTGALANVLKLRGQRYFDSEIGRDDIGLSVDDMELAFPELAGTVSVQMRDTDTPTTGRTINYMALAAPIVEAIRELEARVRDLEAQLGKRDAGH